MRFRLAMFIGACVYFSFGFASAGTAAPVAKPPKPDFSSMRFLLGTWSCTARNHQGPVKYIATYSIDPSGYYLARHDTSHGPPSFPFLIKNTFMITYDSDIKQWARIQTSNFGDYALDVSTGWKGGKLAWHDVLPPADGDYQGQVTWIKLTDTHVTDERVNTTKGVKEVSSRGSCTKSS